MDTAISDEIYEIICRKHQQEIADFLTRMAAELHNDTIHIIATRVRFYPIKGF
jgi:hypothetical protein